MKMRSLIGLLLLTCTGSLFAQTLSFRADQVTVPPSDLNADKGVQVGIYMTTSGVGDGRTWEQISLTMDYTLNGGAVLAADPVARLSDFLGTNTGGFPESGIENPGAPVTGSSFGSADIINVATLGTGPAQSFMGNAADPNNNASGFVTEDVNNVTQRIRLDLTSGNDFFLTNDGEEYLVAIVELPVDQTSPSGSWVDIAFGNNADDNIIQNSDAREKVDAAGNNTDGYVLLFEAPDCAGATAADNLGTASGSSIEINYLDPQAGGVGGDITFTMPHASGDPDQIRIVGSDGYNVTLTGADIGAGSSSHTITTSGDSSPTVGSTVTYEIFYGANNPLGGVAEGTACTVTVAWAAPTCSITPDSQPVAGQPTTLDVVLTNVVYDAGNSRFGFVTLPDASTVDLAAPSATAGNELTFDNAVSIASVSATDVGSYTVSADGADGSAVAGCEYFLGLECPTNNVACPAGEVVIGGTVDITLDGDNVANWDITYNGVTTNVPGSDPTFTVTNLVGTATDVTITANGFDQNGDPCSDDVVCSLNFADPTCTVDSVTWDDGGTTTDVCPDGVDVGTMVTVTITTTGATGAFIPGANIGAGSDVVFTETVGTFGVTDSVTATATFPLTVLGDIEYTVEGPTGTTAPTCTFEACLTTFVTDGNAFLDGAQLCFNGTPNFTFEIYAVPGNNCVDIPFGSNIQLGDLGGSPVLVGTMTTDGDGNACVVLGEDGTTFIPDSCYYIVFNGQVFGGTQLAAVPTLGEWGMIAFVMLLMAAALVQMRKRRLA